MRIRTIKPQFFKNDELGALPLPCRMLFIGLLCMADCEGRLLDRPKVIKAEVFPYDDVEVDNLLTSLANIKVIARYMVAGERYIEVVNFKKHQRLSGKEAAWKSEIPPRPTVKQRGSTGEALVKQRGSTGEAPGNTGKERKGKDIGQPDVDRPIKSEFDEFWNSYPRHVKRRETERVFAKLAAEDQAKAIAGAVEMGKVWADAPADQRRFIPHPTSWLNQARWTDDPAEVAGVAGRSSPPTRRQMAVDSPEAAAWRARFLAIGSETDQTPRAPQGATTQTQPPVPETTRSPRGDPS